MLCSHYQQGSCRSCKWLEKPYERQWVDKQNDLEQLLQSLPVERYLPPVTSQTVQFRNKAKMVVSGSVEKPILGIISEQDDAVDLCDCPLYPAAFSELFPVIKTFIAKAGLVPYNIARKRGELKYILITQNAINEYMLRFVVRSDSKLAQVKNALPWLLEQLPQLKVVSVNIQPVHMAILEGDEEIVLTEQPQLAQPLNHVPLFIQPGSFFQTNLSVAAQLYATAQQWVFELKGIAELPVKHIWDLFCGVGGFGLHCATPEMKLTGIEINAGAIACAKQSAEKLGLKDVHFQALDLTQTAVDQQNQPDIVIVNPPRRGIGKLMTQFLMTMNPPYILYSSCNAQSMAKDIAELSDYLIVNVQLFDMFPHTAHYEVLTLLQRK